MILDQPVSLLRQVEPDSPDLQVQLVLQAPLVQLGVQDQREIAEIPAKRVSLDGPVALGPLGQLVIQDKRVQPGAPDPPDPRDLLA